MRGDYVLHWLMRDGIIGMDDKPGCREHAQKDQPAVNGIANIIPRRVASGEGDLSKPGSIQIVYRRGKRFHFLHGPKSPCSRVKEPLVRTIQGALDTHQKIKCLLFLRRSIPIFE